MKKMICFVTAIAGTAESFLRDHIVALRKEYTVYYVCNELEEKNICVEHDGYHCVDIQRGISIWKDLKAVWHLYRFFRKMKFDAVHSVTPKAGFVTAMAAWMAGIPHRTHIFTGQVWATKQGFSRWMLKAIDKLIASLDNHILVDGKSQRSFLVKEGVLKEDQAEVFCNGSIAGVNAERFVPDAVARKDERDKIGIKQDVLTYIFLGRFNHDKGIDELYEAFNRLAAEVNDVFLLLVGADEEGYLEKVSAYSNIKEGENFRNYGLTRQPERVLNAGDVFVLPTYREGFGSSVLEAACIGLPCICSDAYGVLDAYIPNETGLQCHVGDAESLYQCMKNMYDDRNMVAEMGRKSRERALKDFNVKPISENWLKFYKDILG